MTKKIAIDKKLLRPNAQLLDRFMHRKQRCLQNIDPVDYLMAYRSDADGNRFVVNNVI